MTYNIPSPLNPTNLRRGTFLSCAALTMAFAFIYIVALDVVCYVHLFVGDDLVFWARYYIVLYNRPVQPINAWYIQVIFGLHMCIFLGLCWSFVV
jgi:hypothetical protein